MKGKNRGRFASGREERVAASVWEKGEEEKWREVFKERC
jgi:hypothetical protein